MKGVIRKIFWLIIGITPFLFWTEIYRASTTEYDENWAHFFLAVFISFLTVGLLIFVRNDFTTNIKLKRFVKYFSILVASPLTVGLIIVYQMTIPMQWKWSSSHSNNGKSYSDIKKRNYFKAENYLIIDNLSSTPDTIKATVNRKGELKELVKIKNGMENKIELLDLNNLSDNQKENLMEY